MNLSRTYPEKQENIVFLGTNGYMVLTKHSLKIYNKDNEYLFINSILPSLFNKIKP